MGKGVLENSSEGRARAARPKIGEMLIERGLISQEDLESALQQQRETGRRMGETLVDMGALRAEELQQVLAERLGFEYADLSDVSVDWVVAHQIPEEVARRYQALPLAQRDGRLVVAMANPEDVFALDDIKVLTKTVVQPVMVDPEALRELIERTFSQSEMASSLDDAASTMEEDQDVFALVAEAEDAPIIRLVNALIEQAVDERASDVHIEPGSGRLRIRYRVDGVLHDASEAPLAVHRPLVSRLKVMAGIDITRSRVPHDGRFSLSGSGRQVDIRIATLPTAHGEAVILRLLNRGNGLLSLAELGFHDDELARFSESFNKPQGAIVSSGPTGSGKTSTLYATLLEMHRPELSIITVEDPVEYRIDGIKQIQIDTKAGLTFPLALRSILRADPDVVLVGEIRDLETAKIAAEAALTGHLVLSTIHTTSAAAVPLRLMDMGVEPFLVTSALTCVIGQRLVRRLCERCAEPDNPEVELLHSLGIDETNIDQVTIRRAVGCSYCHNTGYRGRMAIYEIMPMSEEISRLVLSRASSRDIERWGVAEGMDTLRMAAMRRVASGELSIEEMVRVIV
ncbi:MAG TPA: ATPase, T2SS/T4P/T4SS family [Acidimicrobiia bacterium]|nr:ATPase, T2SS/T4P/T4SS family [Acidimicrobiia bacterium]